MTKTLTHTPTPWEVKELHPNYGGHVLVYDTGHGLARIDDKSGNFSKENAALIVRAVNSHQELVALLKEFVTDLDVNKTSTLAEYSARVYKALDRAEKGE